MAKAIPRGGVATNRTLKLAHSAAVETGDVIVHNGQVLVACNTAEANSATSYVFTGPVEMPKKTALALDVGVTVYFDLDPGEITATEADGTQAGLCIEAASATDGAVLVELLPNTLLPTHSHP